MQWNSGVFFFLLALIVSEFSLLLSWKLEQIYYFGKDTQAHAEVKSRFRPQTIFILDL